MTRDPDYVVKPRPAGCEQICGTCRHWWKKPSKSSKSKTGRCDHPEQYIVSPATGQHFQIWTMMNHGCGQWAIYDTETA